MKLYFYRIFKSPNNFKTQKIASDDACTPQPGEIVFNTMRYRNSETVHRSGYFQSSVNYKGQFNI